MKISIIIPVYNVEKYLKECLDSVVTQTYKNIEIIIVNDGSPDNSHLIIEEYAKEDSRIKVINQENRGLSEARNAGFAVSTGSFILFMDSDDKIDIKSIEYLVDLARHNEVEIVHFAYIPFVIRTPLIKHQKESNNKIIGPREAIYRLPPMAWLNFYKRELLLGANIKYPALYHEDEVETYRLFTYAKKILVSDLKLYHYRIRAGSITGTQVNQKSLDLFKVYEILLSISRDSPEFKNEFEFKAFYLLKNKIGVWKAADTSWSKDACLQAEKALSLLEKDITDNPYIFIENYNSKTYENSISWKITKPLRVLKKHLKGIKR